MIPAGYMARKIINNPAWLKTDNVHDIYSTANCMSKPFADYINYWKHNGFWLFDSPEIIVDLAKEHSLNLEGTMFFYYEVYELEFHDDDSKWHSFMPEANFKTNVAVLHIKLFEGYAIATFSVGTSPECSPLSCNSAASVIKTNKHCLMDSFDEAKLLLESGRFNNTEPGPFRIFAVYSVGRP